MKKFILIAFAAIAMIACNDKGQEPSPTDYTKAYLVGFKVMSVKYSGYKYWFDVLDQNGKSADAAGLDQVYNANCPVYFKLLSPKRLDITNTLYTAKMISQEAGGKAPFVVFADGEISAFPMLKKLDFPDELTFYDDNGTHVLGVYEYE